MPRKTRTKKKEKKNISNGVVHIQSTFNNTIITITDTAGNVISWSSSGINGIQRVTQKHPVCRSDDSGRRREEGHGARAEERGSVCKGAGRRAGIRIAFTSGGRVQRYDDQRCYTCAAQWLSSTETASGIKSPLLQSRRVMAGDFANCIGPALTSR